MPESPRHIQSLRIFIESESDAALARNGAEAILRVRVVQPRSRRHFEAGLTGVAVEAERTGPDHSVIGDLARGAQVALQRGVLHELDVAEVGEALAAGGIARGVNAQVGIDTGEIV